MLRNHQNFACRETARVAGLTTPVVRARMPAKENGMRIIIAAILAMTASVALAADELDDAHREALASRDTYWNCLAREYSREANRSLSDQDFTLHVANACPSERQNLRVMLVEYLTLQFPDADAGAHMTTANNAIALAQKDIVTAFVRHNARAK
jgi:hypothetical protein